ncbi:MAG: hypothetical protein JNM17_38780 [Archangium sp.]|nr:hypothetical protein [Archangium sp.]
MPLRTSRVLIAALSVLFTACPQPMPGADGGNTFDAGNPTPRDACSGGCAANQICDIDTKTCVDACGGCPVTDGGPAQTCVKVMEGVFQCKPFAISCGTDVCQQGQVACLGGACSCLSSLSGALDTCQSAHKWCNGRNCANPKSLQQCIPGDMSAACPANFTCQPVFGDDLAVCTRSCMDDNECQRGEACSQVGCLPLGLFRDQECNQNKPAPDGGWERDDAGAILRITVPVSNTCLLKDNAGTPTEGPSTGTGNCTYAVFQFWNDGVYPFDTCRPPGTATEGQPCKDDYAAGALATQCATGLQCAKTRGGDDGVCLRMCNAQPPALGFPPSPACNMDEACVNTLRYTDPNSNSVLGVCMKKCNVFDAMKATCAPVGTNAASCVPTEASGELVVSNSGDGICIPQRPSINMIGEQCSETDSFRGAACGSAQLCTSVTADDSATCTGVCDVECNPADGGTGPTRCATEPNARCTGGKTCRRVTSTSGARVGFCL